MRTFYSIFLLITFSLSGLLFAQDQKTTYSIANEFISIIVNNQDAIGRFALETTGGDPNRIDDDNHSLIYGRPIPWTSYTTILIDDKPYIFGQPDKRLLRRLPKEVSFGTVLFQHRTDDSIMTACAFGDVHVKQTLTFYRNPNTNVKDSALIRYDIVNRSSISTHNIGIRIMLDTKLGQNDGSPLRMGPEAVTEEKLYQQDVLYDYWMTFDNLASPNIVAQGLLKDPSKELTFPDQLYLANWGTLVDEPWDINYKVGRSFIRKGEREKDTALGMYFNPVSLAPNTEYHVQTVYGLGGLSLSLGKLAVGLSMPQELPAGFPDEFLIQGYVLNTGAYQSHDTVISFSLGNDINALDNNLISTFNVLDIGQQKQIPIVVRLSDSAQAGTVPVSLTVKSSTYESNSLTRTLSLLPRLTLDYRINDITHVNYDKQQKAIVSALIQNTTSKKITKVSSKLSLPEGLIFPDYETTLKQIPVLEPGQKENLYWTVTIDQPAEKYHLNL